jgi:hypothetical protein
MASNIQGSELTAVINPAIRSSETLLGDNPRSAANSWRLTSSAGTATTSLVKFDYNVLENVYLIRKSIDDLVLGFH